LLVTFRIPHPRGLALCLVLMTLAALSAFAASPGTHELISIDAAQRQGFGASSGTIGISRGVLFDATNTPDRYVVFSTLAALNRADTLHSDIYVRDRTRRAITLVSVGNAPAANKPKVVANGDSFNPSISDDGRFIAFQSAATNLVAGDANNKTDVFVRDLRGNEVRASVIPAGTDADGDSQYPQISGDGLSVAFESDATNLVAGDTNTSTDVFVRQLQTPNRPARTIRVSTDATGAQTNNGARSRFPSISADGSKVAFESNATNLTPNDQGGFTDIFVKTVNTGAIEKVSVDSMGSPGGGDSHLPFISGDGNFVAFVSSANNLVPNDNNMHADIFVRDLQAGTTTRVSVATDGTEGDDDSGLSNATSLPAGAVSGRPTLSDDGRFVAFVSEATNLLGAGIDNNGIEDVFIHDTADGTTERFDVGSGGAEGDAVAPFSNQFPTISPDGTFVAFQSASTNIVPVDFNGSADIFMVGITPLTALNSPPTADAGLEQTVTEGDFVTLDASASSDPDDDVLDFTWKQVSPATPVVALDLSDPEMPTFTAPDVTDQTDFVFQVSVSDGINPPVTSNTTVHVLPSLAEITGIVTDENGDPVENAVVKVLRNSDNAAATEFTTDFTGTFDITDVHAGDNTITVSAPGFEASIVDLPGVDPAGGVIDVGEIQLAGMTAELDGSVFLSNGAPLVAGTVELLGNNGKVVLDAQGNPLTGTTDSAGEYKIPNIDGVAVSQVATLRISAPSQGLIPWTVASPAIIPGEVSVLDFQYGSLQVSLTGSSAAVRRKLDGTAVELLFGNVVVARNIASGGVRTFTFPNVPAIPVRVRGTNNAARLTGQIVPVTVNPGSTPTTVKITMRPFGIF